MTWLIRWCHDTVARGAPGLKGVAVAETAIGDVRGEEGFYHYRQYDAIKLARERTFEEVWYLLREGALPGRVDLAHFAGWVARERAVSPRVAAALPAIAALASGGQPLQALRAAYELVALDRRLTPWLDLGTAELDGQAVATAAVFPTLAVALYRLARGLQPIEPLPGLGHAASYLYLLDGAEPSPARTRALESYLISTIDHGFNASTYRPGRRLHRRRPRLGGDSRARVAVRPAARRGTVSRARHARRDRHARGP